MSKCKEVTIRARNKEEYIKGVRNFPHNSAKLLRKGNIEGRGTLEKGKGSWMRVSKSKPSHPIYNDSLKIGKEKRVDNRGGSESRSTDTEARQDILLFTNRFKGENSKAGELVKKVTCGLGGYTSSGPQDRGFSEDEKSRIGSQMEHQSNMEEDKAQSLPNRRKVWSKCLAVVENQWKKSQVVQQEHVEDDQRIDLIFDLRGQGVEKQNKHISKANRKMVAENGSTHNSEDQPSKWGQIDEQEDQAIVPSKSSRGKHYDSLIKTHPMKTRGLKDNVSKNRKVDKEVKAKSKMVIWNLEEEITKVIEVGAARGIDMKSRQMSGNIGSNGSVKEGRGTVEWDLDEEVTKNVRGLGNEDKRRKVKSVVLTQKPTVVFIQELKLDGFNSRVLRGLGGVFLSRGVVVDAVRSAGGLITIWNEDLLTVKYCISNKWCLTLVGILNKMDKEMGFYNIYASNSENERRDLWSFVINVQQIFSMPWIIGGDFNTILNESERKGDDFNKWSARAFNNFIIEAKVVDIPLRRVEFTWSNNREKGSWAKLDRFLVSPILLPWLSDLERIGLPRTISDYCAITLGVTKTFIALIPKCSNLKTMKDYRPISLVGSLYKILANRMRRVLDLVVGESQKALVKNNQILKSFIIPDEIIHHWKKSFERGFNGSPTRQFKIEKGLRMVTLFPLFLFNVVVVVEGLRALFMKAKTIRVIEGCHFRNGGGSVLPRGLKVFREVFFWGDGCEKIKIHAVKWESLCKERKRDGLGICSILDKNKGLLAKWVWKLGKEKSPLWKRVICAKYGVSMNALCWNWNGGPSSSFFTKLVLERLDSLYELAGYQFLFQFLYDRLVERLDWAVSRKISKRVWVSLFFAVVWSIWKTKNGKLFKNDEASFLKAVDMVKFRVAWWFNNYGKGSSDPITLILLDIIDRCTDPCKVIFPDMGDWIPPPSDVLKFKGMVLQGNPRVKLDVITADILANARACELCISQMELTSRSIVINSDSRDVVSWINNEDLGNINFSHLINDIGNILLRLGKTTDEFRSRASNSLANTLAKQGSAGEGDVLVCNLS
ncbi:hypothetical protein Ddye_015799 [Dipteronia dyeriana]|uniref:Reverse transcriptase n=1 Tax=Dipteronia dyeriana TaxID=168575 RepID=A0AAD9U6B8_9ROSI|nr:hypothetical protein Ddye_015799 [Dipteronia dyeriana]